MSNQHGEFDDLEQTLRQMPLRAPSPQLDQRIAQTIHRRPATRWMIGLAAATLSAAAAVLLLVRATSSDTQPPSPHPTPTLVASSKSTVSQLVETDEQWSEDGIVDVQSDGPVRQYRLTTTHQITEVENGKLVTMTFPQEEVYQVVSEAF